MDGVPVIVKITIRNQIFTYSARPQYAVLCLQGFGLHNPEVVRRQQNGGENHQNKSNTNAVVGYMSAAVNMIYFN